MKGISIPTPVEITKKIAIDLQYREMFSYNQQAMQSSSMVPLFINATPRTSPAPPPHPENQQKKKYEQTNENKKDLTSDPISLPSNLYLLLDWISKNSMVKRPLNFMPTKSRARIIWHSWLLNFLSFHKETFLCNLLPPISRHLSGPCRLGLHMRGIQSSHGRTFPLQYKLIIIPLKNMKLIKMEIP